MIQGTAETIVEVIVRLLHLTARTVGEIDPPLAHWPENTEPAFRAVEALQIEDRLFQSWQEAEPCEIAVPELAVGELQRQKRRTPFAVNGSRRIEPLLDAAGEVRGVLVREQQPLE